jgi:hypothetical protein
MSEQRAEPAGPGCPTADDLIVLYAVGSPQSRESDERKEEKLDLILRRLDPENADKEIDKLDGDTL